MATETPKTQVVIRSKAALDLIKDALERIYAADADELARTRAETLAKIDSVLGVEKPATDTPAHKFAWLSWYEDAENIRKNVL